MPYAVELDFEEPGALAVRALMDKVAAAGLPTLIERAGYRASLPLAVFGQLDTMNMRLEMKRYAMNLKPFELQLTGVGLAGDQMTAGLTPVMSAELDQAHKLLHNFLRKVVQSPRPEYFVGRWQPVVPLGEAYSPMQAQKLRDLAPDLDLPIRVVVRDACVVNVNPSRVQTVFQVQLETAIFRDRS